jgi:hypothetical protein
MRRSLLVLLLPSCIVVVTSPDDDGDPTHVTDTTDTDAPETGDTGTAGAGTGDTGAPPERNLMGDLDLDVIAAATVIGAREDASAGRAIASVPDLTGDGVSDVVVGTNTAEVYVLAGPLSGDLEALTDSHIVTHTSGSFGRSAAAGAEADGDGQNDLFVADGTGIFVIAGPIAGPVDASLDSLVELETYGLSNSGTAMQVMSDVTGDGLADLLLGGSNYGTVFNDGIAFILPAGGMGAGGLLLIDDLAVADIHPVQSGANFGAEVGSQGDHDGDGVEDLLIGSPKDQTGGVLATAGAFFVFDSTVTGFLDTTAAEATVFSSAQDSGGLGGVDFADEHRLDFAGDVNGDGYDDVVASREREDAAGAEVGTAYLVHGPMAGTADVVDVAHAEIVGTGAVPFGHEALYVKRAGDLDGDGFADYAAGGGDTVFLFYGPGPSGVVLAQETADARLFAFANLVGQTMQDVPDMDGDGYNDLLIGSWNSSNLLANDGTVWLVLGGVP